MVILSLDTTTRAGSCALWRDGALVEERPGDAARTHAERLPGDLADLLAAHGLRVGDVDLYAVASGPGSFTGLRVGIATIQGLALVHGRKVVPISALEALAHAAMQQIGEGEPAVAQIAGLLVGAWMEAYRGEVFGALYLGPRARPGAALPSLEEMAGAAVGSPASLAEDWARRVASLATGSAGLVIIGDAVPTTRHVLEAVLPGARLVEAVPLAAAIARLAHEQPGRAVRPHAIVPVYVRRPDAELARDRRAARESCSPTT